MNPWPPAGYPLRYPMPGGHYPPPGYYAPPPPLTPPGYLRRERWVLALGAALALIASIAGAITGGFLGALAEAGLMVWPFTIVGWFAHMGVRRFWARVVAWIVGGLLLLLVALSLVGMAGEAYPDAASLRGGVYVAAAIATLATAVMATPLARPVMRRLGLRPDDHAHHVALVLAVGLTAFSLAPLVGTGGRALLLDLMARHPERDDHDSALETLLPLVWIIPGAFVLVGYGVHRGAATCRERLGLRWPGWRAVGLGAGLGLVLVPVALGLDYLLTHAVGGLGLPTVDEDQLDRLFDVPTLTLASSAAVALVAGVGEELAVRGVLQPRLGVVFANLFFAAGHALQYSIDGVVSVFVLGLAFGVLRRRTSTIASMVAHATYDFALFVLILAGA
jgi:membrane protease YdiL (CAAX protease family)